MARREHSSQAEDGDREYTFTNVQLFKNETLGTGSYGAVCRAKCDQLVCAAKLIWPALLQLQAPDSGKEHRQPFQRFESECRFLSRINHPNIVQYLGTYRDPETNAPVLLMELMDESLTHYLQSSPGDIPYHIQVNLASDIAQALSFLHANGIIHRDLSSNNVLLIAGSRAKVTDFGMLKFTHLNTTRLATMTTCPGTPAFMSPEALNEPPVYTEKLDNFSFGVLLVQIVTRQFPKPSNRFEIVQIPAPRNPLQIVEAQIAIPEVERRQAHISLIEPTHPLLRMTLDCLKDRDIERPSSQQLCQSLDALKRIAKYEESSQQDVRQLLRAKDEEIRNKDQQLQANQEEIRAKDEQIGNKDQQLDEQIRARDKQLQAYQDQVHLKDMENRQLTERLGHITQDNQALQNDKATLQRENNALQNDNATLQHTNCALQQEKNTLQLENQVLQNDSESKERKLRRLNEELEANEEITASFQQTITQRDREVSELRGMLTSKNKEIQDLSSQLDQVALDEPKATPTRIRMAWKSLPDIPEHTQAGSSTVIGGRAYFKVYFGEIIHEFNSTYNQWGAISPPPLKYFTIVSVSKVLTTVGGRKSSKLYSYINSKWVEYFPPMLTKRQTPAVVYANHTLVVVGGGDGPFLSMVETLNTQSKRWSSVSSLPFPISFPSMTICRDKIYLHNSRNVTTMPSVLKCSLRALLQSKPSSAVWERIASLPVHQSSLATIDGQLLAVGGLDEKNKPIKDIHQYNPTTDSWKVVSQMSVARYDCLTASLPGNILMVVGGEDQTNSHKVEMATITRNLE